MNGGWKTVVHCTDRRERERIRTQTKYEAVCIATESQLFLYVSVHANIARHPDWNLYCWRKRWNVTFLSSRRVCVLSRNARHWRSVLETIWVMQLLFSAKFTHELILHAIDWTTSRSEHNTARLFSGTLIMFFNRVLLEQQRTFSLTS